MAQANKETFWRFENNASNNSEATLYIYGDIVTYDLRNWNWPDDVVPNKFKDELKALGDVKLIHVRINSNGGSVFAAYAIMNLLKTHSAKIITYNDGIAASAATIIAMAGDKIVTALGSVWMVHLPSTYAYGNAHDLSKAVNVLNTITQSMIDIYHDKTGIERVELEKMLNDDTWMTGSQALEKGFVDEIAGQEVIAYLSDDRKAAFFNSVSINLDKVPSKDVLVAMLPIKSQTMPDAGQDKEEENTMTLADLKAKHPEVYEAAVNEGKAQSNQGVEGATKEALANARNEGIKAGVEAERNRMKAIDEIAMPGTEALTNRAKYETHITAEQYAVAIVKAQKEKGANYLNALQADVAELDDVPAAGAPQTDETEETALLAYLASQAKKY